MPTAKVDVTQVGLLSQIILRAGNMSDPRAQQAARDQYQRPNTTYSDLKVGLSCLFHPGASFDDLAREGVYPNTNLSVVVLQRLIEELATIGYEPVLYVTPISGFPSHHTLVFFQGGMLEQILRDNVLSALVRAMMIVKNPYQPKKP